VTHERAPPELLLENISWPTEKIRDVEFVPEECANCCQGHCEKWFSALDPWRRRIHLPLWSGQPKGCWLLLVEKHLVQLAEIAAIEKPADRSVAAGLLGHERFSVVATLTLMPT
jgi:hypothetical protein